MGGVGWGAVGWDGVGWARAGQTRRHTEEEQGKPTEEACKYVIGWVGG